MIDRIMKAISDDLYIFIEQVGGELRNSKLIKDAHIDIKDNIFEINFPYYIEYVNSGRRKGAKMPPVNAIVSWCRSKGLPTDNATVYKIRQGIAKNGIKPRPILDKFFNLVDSEWEHDWADKIFKELIKDLDDWFKI